MDVPFDPTPGPYYTQFHDASSRDRMCMNCHMFKSSNAFSRIGPSNPSLHPWCKTCRYAPLVVKTRELSQRAVDRAPVQKLITPSSQPIPTRFNTVHASTIQRPSLPQHVERPYAESALPVIVRQKRTVKLRTKICVRCQAVKEAAEFPQAAHTSSGSPAVCSECTAVVTRKRTARRPAAVRNPRFSAYDLQKSDEGEGDVEEDVVAAAAALGGLAAGAELGEHESDWVVSKRGRMPVKSEQPEYAGHAVAAMSGRGEAGRGEAGRGDTGSDAQGVSEEPSEQRGPRRSKRQVQQIKFDDSDSDWEESEEYVTRGQRPVRGRKRLRVDEPTVQEKACTKCKQLKHASEFTRCSTHSTGLHPWCRDCTNEASKKRQEQMRRPHAGRSSVARHNTSSYSTRQAEPRHVAHDSVSDTLPVASVQASTVAEKYQSAAALTKEPIMAVTQLRKCTHCHVEKQCGEFYKCAAMTSGLHPWCKQCMKEVQRRNKRARPALPSME